ncbi:MAG: hypothetical protein H7Y17_00470, partial [Chlorobia bacterium]|nr:hypothetical protein [Fimbriimonadaceae bacterium]
MFVRVLDWIYPPKCGLCGRFGPESLCGICRSEFVELDREPRELKTALSEVTALFKYETRAAQAVRRLKYSRITSLAEPLSTLIVEGYQTHGLDQFDLIVPIPIHWRRRAMRG